MAVSDDCENIEFQSTPAEKGGFFITEVCSTKTALPIPDELKKKEGVVETARPLELPQPLYLGSHAVDLDCPDDGSHGPHVRVGEFTYQAIVYFSSVPSITRAVLDNIAKKKLEPQISKEWHENTLTAQKLHTLTGMTVSNGKSLLQQLQTVQNRLDSAAKMAAENMLYCEWCNDEIVVECPDPAMVKEGVYDGNKAVYQATVAEGMYCSVHGKEDANQLAREAAESMLNCFYVNDPCVATCENRPDRPAEVMEPVPNDTEPIYPGRSLRVGTAVVNAGIYYSYESKEAANEQACNAAYSMLNCWYPNLEVYAECNRECWDEAQQKYIVCPDGEIRARNNGVKLSDEPTPRHANPAQGTRGQIVRIPVGMFESEFSTEYATIEAEEYAESLLECCYVNEKIEIQCDAEEVVLLNGSTAIIYPEPEPISPRTSVTVEEGTFTSCVSQEEANQFALDSTVGLLQCVYCNVEVDCECCPDWVNKGIHDGSIALPIEGTIISDGTNSISVKSLPHNATVGIPQGRICDSSAQQAQNLANSLAQAPFSGNAETEYCTFYNDLVIAGCKVSDPYGQVTPETTAVSPNGILMGMGETPDGYPYLFCCLYPRQEHCVDQSSYPHPGGYISMPAGMWSDYGADKKQDLNMRALEYALSIMSCNFINPEIKGVCGEPDNIKDLCSPWTFGKNSHIVGAKLVEWASTRERPVYVPAGMILKRGRGGDYAQIFAEIKAEAEAMVRSKIQCVYCNSPQFWSCPETKDEITGKGSFECGPMEERVKVSYETHELVIDRVGIVPECVVTAELPGDADLAALQLAESHKGCNSDTWTEYAICAIDGDNYPNPTPDPTDPDDGGWGGVGGGGGGTPTPPPNNPNPPGGGNEDDDENCLYPYCPLYIAQERAKKTANAAVPVPVAVAPTWEQTAADRYQQLLDELAILENELLALTQNG